MYVCEYAFELGVNDGIIHSEVEMKYSRHPKIHYICIRSIRFLEMILSQRLVAQCHLPFIPEQNERAAMIFIVRSIANIKYSGNGKNQQPYYSVN